MSRGPRAVEVVLSDEEPAELLRWAGGAVAPRLAERARIVLACAEGKPNMSIPSQCGDDLCGQSLGEGGLVLAFVVDRALEPAHAV